MCDESGLQPMHDHTETVFTSHESPEHQSPHNSVIQLCTSSSNVHMVGQELAPIRAATSYGSTKHIQWIYKRKLCQLVEGEDEKRIYEITNMFRNGPKPDQYYVDFDNNSFLHLAASKNKLDILQRFLSHELCFLYKKPNAYGDLPLHVAIRHGNADAVRCLLGAIHRPGNGYRDCRLTLSKKNSESRTALHIAVLHHRDGHIVKLVMEAMIRAMLFREMNAADTYHRTALHYAIQICSERKCYCDCIQQLSSLNPGPTTKRNKISALHLAAKLGDQQILYCVLRTFYYKGTKHDIDALNSEDRTALMICAENGDFDGFKLLLCNGATVGKVNKKNQNILHLMVQMTVKEPHKVEPILHIFKIIVNYFATSTTHDAHYPPFDVDRTNVFTLQKKESGLSKSLFKSKQSVEFVRLLTQEYAPYDKGNYNHNKSDGKHYNVIQLAAYIDASEIFREILKITNSVRTKIGRKVWHLDYIIPSQIQSSDTSDEIVGESEHSTQVFRGMSSNKCQKSCLELIILNCDEENVETFHKMAQVEPIRTIVTKLSYGRIAIGSFLFVLHIIYMSVLSVYALQTLTSYNNNNTSTAGAEQNEVYRNPTPYLYCLFLVYPLIMCIVMFISCVESCTCSRQLVQTRNKYPYYETNYVVFSVVSLIASLLFSIVVIVWYVLYLLIVLQHSISFTMYAKAVAVTLLIGWLYAIELMRAIPKFQAFTKSLKLIIVKDVLRIVCVYAMVLAGFALAIHVCILVESTNAESVLDTFFETVGTMFGNADLFGAGSAGRHFDSLSYASDASLSGFFRGLLAMYMLMSYIILINVLISMLQQSYSLVYMQTEILWEYETCKKFVYLSKQKLWRSTLRNFIFKDLNRLVFWDILPVVVKTKSEIYGVNNIREKVS